ncbi:MAG: hypothetical protein V1774_10625 [Candidatus Eisenbacteria bacterium]
MAHSRSEPPEGRRLRLCHFLWLLTPALFPLLRWGGVVLPAPLRVLLALLVLVLLPGWLLQSLILSPPRVGVAARVTRAFLLGVGFLSAVGMIAWFFGGDVGLGDVGALVERPALPGRLTAVLWSVPLLLFVGALSRILFRRPAEVKSILAAGPQAKETGARQAEADVPQAAEQSFHAFLNAAARERETPEQRIVREAYLLGEQQRGDRPLAPRWATLVVLGGILLFAAALTTYAGGSFRFDSDVPAHLAAVREMLQSDRILPRTAFHADGDGASIDPRLGFFHVALAAIGSLARVDSVYLFDTLPVFLTVFALIIFHTFARRVLRSEGTTLLATFLAFICFGEAHVGMLPRTVCAGPMGIVLSWGVLSLILRFVSGDGRRRLLWLVGIAAFGATATHVFASIYVLFSLGVLTLVLWVLPGRRKGNRRRAALAWGAAAIGCLPVLVWRLQFAGAALNPDHTQPQGLLGLGADWFIVAPQSWIPFLGTVGVGGILFSLLLWKRSREGAGVIYLAALSAAPFLVLLDPLAIRILEPRLGYLIARFATLIPFVLVLAYVARWMGESLLELTSARRVITSLVVYVIMVALLFPRLDGFARSYSAAALEREEERSILTWRDLLKALDDETRAPAVVLSDPITGYSIPALTRHRTVAVLYQHGSPADPLARERWAAARDVLSPYLGTGEKARHCRRFGVDYVLVNAALPAQLEAPFPITGPRLAQRQIAALDQEQALFARVWEVEGRGVLYRVRRENLDALSGIVKPGAPELAVRTTDDLARPIVWRQLPRSAIPVLPDTSANVTLVAATIDSSRIAPGDTLGMSLFWRKMGTTPAAPVVYRAWLETRSPGSPGGPARISRVLRKLDERRHRVRRRMEVEGEILEGQFGLEHWPRERYLFDRVTIPVPRDAVPGSYAVRISWSKAFPQPNPPASHLLSDQAADRGPTVGTVEIR